MKMDYDTAQNVAEVLKALGHPVRLQIVELLERGELCVGDIVDTLSITQSAASQQLGLLKDKQVLQWRRDGTKVFYSIKNKNVIKLLECIDNHCENK